MLSTTTPKYTLPQRLVLKCLSCLVTAENKCAFNNNKLFKKFGEKLAVTVQELLHVYLHRLMRKRKLLPSTPRCGLYFPPRRASEIPMGRGSKRRQFPRGWGQILKGFFSRDFQTRIIVFTDDLSLTVIAECFFHSLCHRLIMPIIQLVIALCFTM